jgi:hypothetical protein
MTTDDIITRCADYFLTILVEGDADARHYDRFTHALVDAYLRDCGIVHLGDDTDHAPLELALELSRLCDHRAANLVLGAIEHALDQLDGEDEAAESLVSSELARKWVAIAATSPIGWAA